MFALKALFYSITECCFNTVSNQYDHVATSADNVVLDSRSRTCFSTG